MFRKIALGLVVASLCTVFAAESSAQSPYEFQFGYALGIQNSFRNRLPTPPYFSIYPPVYYGKRYARPFGESPYASWPLLQSSPDYHAVPVGGHVVAGHPYNPKTITNPFLDSADLGSMPRVSGSHDPIPPMHDHADSAPRMQPSQSIPSQATPASPNRGEEVQATPEGSKSEDIKNVPEPARPASIKPVVIVNPFVNDRFAAK